MKKLLGLSVLLALASQTMAGTVYDQPLDPAGGSWTSSWVPPDGTDSDMWVWEDFKLGANASISDIKWYGNYQYGGPYGKAKSFVITFYPSIIGDFQPDVTHPICHYNIPNNASETLVSGGTYSYATTLTTPFNAVAGTKYWIQIEAEQPGYPDWSWSRGMNGTGQHFRFSYGMAMYNMIPGDTAFSLGVPDVANYTITGTPTPVGEGTVVGSGAYLSGTPVTITAKPTKGYAFVQWDEGTQKVSTAAQYSFTVTKDRNLVANFVPKMSSFVINPLNVTGGVSTTGTVNLAAPALAACKITFTSTSPVMANVPSFVWVPAGAKSVTFPIGTYQVPNDASADITAKLGKAKLTVRMVVLAPRPESLSLSSDIVTGGTSVTGNLSITGIAPGGGSSILLSSSDPSVTVPTYAYVSPGQKTTTFAVTTKPVLVQTVVTITATMNGVSKLVTLTLNP